MIDPLNVFLNLSSNKKQFVFLIIIIIVLDLVIYFDSFSMKTLFNVEWVIRDDENVLMKHYGYYLYTFLWFIRELSSIPYVIFSFVSTLSLIGLVAFNSFPDHIELKFPLMKSPFILFRVVTRGDYPDLVYNNVLYNLDQCLKAGLINFVIEVVSQREIQLPVHERIRKVIVPEEYQTKNKTKFKARNLQYALEDEINILKNDDWIAHLDEDTLLTEDSIYGIVNFVNVGKHLFGQGSITYAKENPINRLTMYIDLPCIAYDMGKLRLQLKCLHRPIFGWKGTFCVAKHSAERDVSYDFGNEGSIGEDYYFALLAIQKGYTFDFIEGTMLEVSPNTLSDMIKQRHRWLYGLYKVTIAKRLYLRTKFFVVLSFINWLLAPVMAINLLSTIFLGFPRKIIKSILMKGEGIMIIIILYSTFRSVKIMKLNNTKFILTVILIIISSLFTLITENAALFLFLFTRLQEFYVVDKIAYKKT